MTTKPFKYQKQCAIQIERFGGRALVALPPGLGKSLLSLLWAYWNPEIRPIVVVCPASVKWSWQREAATHFNMRAEVLETTKPTSGWEILQPQILIINYDILYAWVELLKKLSPKLVILDEVHVLGNPSNRWTKASKKLCLDVPHVLGLSGTPFTSMPAQLFPILNIIRPDLYPRFVPYADQWCNPQMKPWGMDYSGSNSLHLLHKRLLKTLMIRMTREEVIDQLPEKQRIVIPMEISKKEEYEHAESDFLGWLSTESPAKAHRAARAESLVKFGYLKRLAARLKLLSVFEWVDNFLRESEEKLVLFAIHKDVIGALKARYAKNSTVVDGSVRGHARQLAIDQFQNCAWCRLFIGNIKSAGTGINGLTAANTVAFAELEWTPGVISQAEDRVYCRQGDLHGAIVYFLVAHNTVEEKLAKILQKKQKVLDAALDGKEDSSDMDIFDQLKQEMLKQSQKNITGNKYEQSI